MRCIKAGVTVVTKDATFMNKPVTHPNDALNYLPRRPLVEHPKGHVVYSGSSDALYLVAAGRVKVSSLAANGGEAIVRIVPSEGLFGEECLIDHDGAERATALDRVQLMAWKRSEIEQHVEKEPRLGLALMEELVINCLDMEERMQAMASCKTPERVMLSLLQLARRLGESQPDGATRMASLTHHTIADHVGTSREIVSSQMSRLRRAGLVSYSRRHIDVYCQAMEDALRSQGLAFRASPRITAAGAR
jgi:CRP/FNR family transcriptional regulator, cyclic AMP receptor protein